tara:strand:- start:120813 stop:121103 length:291 start_codon:yes stop_codon:yes gene_type:complete
VLHLLLWVDKAVLGYSCNIGGHGAFSLVATLRNTETYLQYRKAEQNFDFSMDQSEAALCLLYFSESTEVIPKMSNNSLALKRLLNQVNINLSRIIA